MKQSLQSKEHGTHPGILAVAERLFGEIGFEKTTVSDIARELRMSPANVYRFFSAKAEINEAVGRRLLRAVEAAGEEIVKQPRPASEKLRAFLAASKRRTTSRFRTNRKLHDLLETAFSENWPIAHDHIEKITSCCARSFLKATRRGVRRRDCELAAILVRSASMRFWHPRLMVDALKIRNRRWIRWLTSALRRSCKRPLRWGTVPQQRLAAGGRTEHLRCQLGGSRGRQPSAAVDDQEPLSGLARASARASSQRVWLIPSAIAESRLCSVRSPQVMASRDCAAISALSGGKAR